MKLQHLPMGGRFEYDGQIYTKTGPLTACSETGGQRIIPRHVTLRPLDWAAAPASGNAGKVDAATVLAAFSAYHQRCRNLVDASAWPELEAAQRAFMAALK